MKIKKATSENQINAVGITSDTISSRGGLSLILRYLDNIGIQEYIEEKLHFVRISSKAKNVWEHVRQIFASFIDGTDTSMQGFDRRKNDPEYAATLERCVTELISGESMRRFFKKFLGFGYLAFRPLLHHLFVWRLNVEKPSCIFLFIDTMVLDNDNALKREGVNPTYKPVKGFQPLHIHWNNYIVDMVFRSGEKHSNHGKDTINSVAKIVNLIRKKYDENIPIILSSDSGFLSDENLRYFEKQLRIHYICFGRCYQDLYLSIEGVDVDDMPIVKKGRTSWQYYDFGSRLKSWKTFRRTIYTSLYCEDDQYILPGLITDSFIYTNIGTDKELDDKLKSCGMDYLLEAQHIVKTAHRNGASELNHRSIKEFMGSEHLPFKRFGMNGAYYYLIVISHFLSEAYREDVAYDVIPVRCYTKKFRRTLIDFAAKIIKTGHQIILKVTRTIWTKIKFSQLWERCLTPIPLPT